MYIETWYRLRCPNCKAENWVNNGDTNDWSGTDIEAVECHSCGKCFSLEGDIIDPEEAYAARGKLMVESK